MDIQSLSGEALDNEVAWAVEKHCEYLCEQKVVISNWWELLEKHGMKLVRKDNKMWQACAPSKEDPTVYDVGPFYGDTPCDAVKRCYVAVWKDE